MCHTGWTLDGNDIRVKQSARVHRQTLWEEERCKSDRLNQLALQTLDALPVP
ncbi:hypothetical protein AA0313_2944 [Acetobacter indonesiensis NRIC 0313]|uniref:Uncharacterized protein n=1 Tax=Acetobacter indonesiensis TaxID=104101 RepID=A0A6N3T8F6_9PROT|nr:hypothetical protein Abin_003_007 [Acetobacter indonesiensis]GBQ62341.1 hypothetical protein AA0313_2944 [Acetobacter indonesiensis NRIC 0313]GEN04845.1 hypothetical protein AIN02nite_28700 [Acetobacter indonesiensis]